MMARFRNTLLATTALMPFGIIAAAANPLGSQVVGGTASVQGQGTSTVTVTQSTDRAIINWNTFNISRGETTRFAQPNSSSVTLNRVTGGLGASAIEGTLTANGRVFLVNPDGILFGAGAKVNTGSFLATTNDIRNGDFMAGRYQFNVPGRPDASIVNFGTITAQNGGFAALVAPGVRNTGTVTANLGTVGLAAGNSFSLDFYGDKLITLGVNDSIAAKVIDVATGKPLNALVQNDGKLKANGGRVELTAAAARQVVDSVINNRGVIEANSIGSRNGMIVLGAATAATKPGGAATQTIKLSGTISAAGKRKNTKGGTIVVSGEDIQLTSATINASGQASGGKVLIGGDVGGGRGNAAVANNPAAALESFAVPTASTVNVDAATTIDASARAIGTGGKVVVWSDQATTFYGTIRAQGGPQSGNGGFVETSGHQSLTFNGFVNTSAPRGSGGTLLLDPQNALITTNAGPGVVTVASIQAALSNGDVVVTTGSGGSDVGDLTVAANINWATSNALTLSAYRNVVVNANITNTSVDGSLISVRADNTGTGVGTVTFGPSAKISTPYIVSIFFNPTVNPAGSLVNPSSYVNPVEDYTTRVPAGAVVVPYMLVNSVHDLQNIQNNLTGAYALGRNIDASPTVGWNGGAGFIPIGNHNSSFAGLFDGQSHSINSLHINSPNTYVGLFGASTGSIFDVGLTNANVISTATNSFVGALAGALENPLSPSPYFAPQPGVFGSYATGLVLGTGSNGVVGGLVGQSAQPVDHSYANVTANSVYVAGGLVGWLNAPGFILQSFAIGAANAGLGNGTAAAAGGLVGVNNGSIYQSYATGAADVAAGSGAPGTGGYAGGLVGFNTGQIFQSYSTGRVIGAGTIGGLAGYSFVDYYSYWDTQTSGQQNGSGGGVAPSSIGLLSANLQAGLPNGFNTTSSGGFSLGVAWGQDPLTNGGYPHLLWQDVSAPFLRTFGGILPVAGTTTILQPATILIPVTVTADPALRLYGNADPFLSYQITSGALAGTDAFSGSLVRTPGESVGTYSILQGSLTLPANYNLTFLSSTLIIQQRPILVTANAQNRISGTPNPVLTYAVGGLGLVGGDSLSGALATTATANSLAGTYPITHGTLSNPNYAITYVGANLTVTSAPSASQPLLPFGVSPLPTLQIANLVSGSTVQLSAESVTNRSIVPSWMRNFWPQLGAAIEKANRDGILAVQSDPEFQSATTELQVKAMLLIQTGGAQWVLDLLGDVKDVYAVITAANKGQEFTKVALKEALGIYIKKYSIPLEGDAALIIGYATRDYEKAFIDSLFTSLAGR
jgi:filamentous hemagglutinin family protein